MKVIIINARFLTQTVTGVQRYAIEVVKALDNLIDCGEIDLNCYRFVLLAPQSIKYKFNLKHIQVKPVGFFRGHIWEQLDLLFYVRNDMLLNLCNVGPLFKRNQIVVMHDAAVFANPNTFSFVFRIWYKVLLKCLGILAKKIITVSFFSKKELVKHIKINKKKILVIYEGKEHILVRKSNLNILRKHKLTKNSFLLAVSSISPNKNFNAIIQAIEILGNVKFDIVIAGGTNPKVFGHSQKALPDNVKYLGYVSDSELKALYENAACFVFPSFYEGFGLPPLEAMACGCPVIVSNAASLPEVCGDAALYCDPYSPEDIANKIQMLMNDANLRESLRQKGLERAKQFSWEKCARETLAVIEKVLSE